MRAVGARTRTREETNTPVPLAPHHLSYGLTGAFMPSGAEAQMRALGSNGTLFAVIEALATAEAGPAWHMYRTLADDAPEGTERQKAPRHPALWLWNNPNKFYSRPRLMKTVSQHENLVGEGILAVAKLGSLPVGLWPIQPHRMHPVPHPTRYLAGWVYISDDGERIPLGHDQVIQIIQNPCPWDHYRGMGAVQTILSDLYGAAAAAEWHRNFFRNQARPDGVIEIPEDWSPTQFETFQERWREVHQGISNVGRIAVLENGAKFAPTTYKPQEMQFAELRGISHDAIRGAFRVSNTVLGRNESETNRATAEASRYMFDSWLVVPRLACWRDEALNFRLLPMFEGTGEGYEFDFVNPTPQDKEAADRERTSKTTSFATLIAAGVHPDDAAQTAGLPKMRVTARPAPEPTVPTSKPPKAVAYASNGHGHARLAFGRQPAALPRAAADDDEEDAPDLTGVSEDLDEALEALEEAWEPIQTRWVDALVEQVEQAAASGDFDSLDVGDIDEAADVIRSALAGMAETARDRAVAELAEQGVTVDPPELDEGVKDLAIPEIANFGGELVKVARSLAKRLGGILAGMAGDVAEQLWRPGVKAEDLASRVRDFLAPTLKKDWKTREERFGGALRRSTNIARLTVQGAALKVRRGGRIVATEVLDESTCTREKGETVLRCREIDGTAYATPAEAWADYGAGVYRLCRGRWRCRGTTRAEWGGKHRRRDG